MATRKEQQGSRFTRNLRQRKQNVRDFTRGAFNEAVPEETRNRASRATSDFRRRASVNARLAKRKVSRSSVGRSASNAAESLKNMRTPEGRAKLRNTVDKGVKRTGQAVRNVTGSATSAARSNSPSAATRANENIRKTGRSGSASGSRFVVDSKGGVTDTRGAKPNTDINRRALSGSRAAEGRYQAPKTESFVNDTTQKKPSRFGRTLRFARGAAGPALAAYAADEGPQLGARIYRDSSDLATNVTGDQVDFSDTGPKGNIQRLTDTLSGRETGFQGQRANTAGLRSNSPGLFSTPEQFAAINPNLPPEEGPDGPAAPPPDSQEMVPVDDTQGAPGKSMTKTATSSPGEPGAIDPNVRGGSINNDGRKRLTLRDTLAGFQRSGNPLADAMKLQARLGLGSAHNTNLRNDLEFGETQRQNDFDNAINLADTNSLIGKRAADAASSTSSAQSAADKVDLDNIKLENDTLDKTFKDIDTRQDIGDDEKQALKDSHSRTQAIKVGYDPRHRSTQTVFANTMQTIADNQEGIGGRLAEALPQLNILGVDVGGSPNFKIGDVLDPAAPTFSPGTMDLFSISDKGNTLMVQDPETGQTNPVFDLDEIGKQERDTLMEMFAGRKKFKASLRRGQ